MILTMLTVVTQLWAQDISVDGLRIDIKSEEVELEFGIEAGKKAAKRGRTLIITPVLKSNGGTLSLPFVVVEGRASKAVVGRHEMAAGTRWNGTAIPNGGSTVYKAAFPYEEWMEGAAIELHGLDAGCCGARRVDIGTLAGEVMVTRGYDTVEVPVEMPPVRKLTTAGKLALDLPFILPVTAEAKAVEAMADKEIFEDTHPVLVEMLTETRDNTLTIYFHQGESRIDHSYAGNNASLVKLISAVRAIEESSDSRIVRVMIAGFASPEGRAGYNEAIARDRALAIKSFLNQTSPVYGSMVTIYNGREDWSGLRRLVAESDMPHREEVLDIIDNAPVWDNKTGTGRRGRLMNLRGGVPYRYMFREFFPQLRNAAYIRVYYENIEPK